VREGEVDIIAAKPDEIIFVEVRARRGRNFGTPEESITGRKAAHVRAAAAAYLLEHPDAPETQRIDVIALELDAKGRVLRVEQIENAIEDE
jgi:putative endonuclease